MLLNTERYVVFNQTPSTEHSEDTEKKNSSRGIIMDIAACDGPVFFERVINKAFKNYVRCSRKGFRGKI